MKHAIIHSIEQGLECCLFTSKECDYADRLINIANFLIQDPSLAPSIKNTEFGSKDYWMKINKRFFRERRPIALKESKTVPDPMVKIILLEHFGIETDLTCPSNPIEIHQKCMVAENFIGKILEKYIASKVEPIGWTWCSGSVVKSIDFLVFENGEVSPLQIKNRDNSENSSSASVRKGTEILKWFRTFSRTGKTNWVNFPETGDNVTLSEEDFQRFALQSLR